MPRLTSIVAAGAASTATAVAGKVGSPGAAVEVPAVHDIATLCSLKTRSADSPVLFHGGIPVCDNGIGIPPTNSTLWLPLNAGFEWVPLNIGTSDEITTSPANEAG